MTMTDEQIIREVVGRMANEAPAALDVDELGDPLIQPGRRDSSRRQSVNRRVAVAITAVAVTLLVGGLTWILAGGGSPPPVADAPGLLDGFSSGDVVYEFRIYPNSEGPEAPCVGIEFDLETGGRRATMACPTEVSEELEYASYVHASPWTFVVGYGLEDGETIAVDDAIRVITTEQVNRRRFFLIQFGQPVDESFRVPVTRPDGTTRFITVASSDSGALTGISGRLPDGTSYEVAFDSPPTTLEPNGISAAIVLDLGDDPETRQRLGCVNQCQAVAIGVTTFTRTPSPTSFEEGTFRISSGDWTMSIDLYEDILDLWGEETEKIMSESITRVDVQDGLPAFVIESPLRWGTDTELPLQMYVDYESFVVQRGCGDSSVGCSPSGHVQVIPAQEVFTPAPEWNYDTTVTVIEPGQ